MPSDDVEPLASCGRAARAAGLPNMPTGVPNYYALVPPPVSIPLPLSVWSPVPVL